MASVYCLSVYSAHFSAAAHVPMKRGWHSLRPNPLVHCPLCIEKHSKSQLPCSPLSSLHFFFHLPVLLSWLQSHQHQRTSLPANTKSEEEARLSQNSLVVTFQVSINSLPSKQRMVIYESQLWTSRDNWPIRHFRKQYTHLAARLHFSAGVDPSFRGRRCRWNMMALGPDGFYPWTWNGMVPSSDSNRGQSLSEETGIQLTSTDYI